MITSWHFFALSTYKILPSVFLPTRDSVLNRAGFHSVSDDYDGENAIWLVFRDHLASIENQAQSFRTWRQTDCAGTALVTTRHAWRTKKRALKRKERPE